MQYCQLKVSEIARVSSMSCRRVNNMLFMQDKLPSGETLSSGITDVTNTDFQPSTPPNGTSPPEKEVLGGTMESVKDMTNEDIVAGLSQQSQSQPGAASTLSPETMSEVCF